MINFLINICKLHPNQRTTLIKMNANQTRYVRPANYARSYLTDREVYVWKHHSSRWAKAIYNKERDTFTGIYSWGEHEDGVSLHHIGMKMADLIGRKSCNAWAEFKTANGESIERLDIEAVAPLQQRIEERRQCPLCTEMVTAPRYTVVLERELQILRRIAGDSRVAYRRAEEQIRREELEQDA